MGWLKVAKFWAHFTMMTKSITLDVVNLRGTDVLGKKNDGNNITLKDYRDVTA